MTSGFSRGLALLAVPVASLLAVLWCALALGAVGVTAAAQGTSLDQLVQPEAGDVDCDGELTVADALGVVTIAAGARPGSQSCVAVGTLGANLARGDLDSDGVVSVADALLIAQCSAGIIRAECPPAPTVDPTLGDVNCDGVLSRLDEWALASYLDGAVEVVSSVCDVANPSGETTIDLSRADITQNDTINRADVLQIRMCADAYQTPSLILRSNACPRTGTESAPFVGDTNCDGAINAADAQAIEAFLAGVRPGVQSCSATQSQSVNLGRSEVNGDGVISAEDASLLVLCLETFDIGVCPRSIRGPEPLLPPVGFELQQLGDVDCSNVFNRLDVSAAEWHVRSGVYDVQECDQGGQAPGRGDIDRDRRLTVEDIGLLDDCLAGIESPLCPSGPDTIDESSPAIGDVNCDGVRTPADVNAIDSVIAGSAATVESCDQQIGTEVNVSRADINNDGAITSADAALLTQCLGDPTAVGCPAQSCGALNAAPDRCVYDQRVLSVRFMPRDPAAPELLDPWAMPDQQVADGVTVLVDEIRRNINDSEHAALSVLANATRYRGYANPDAVPAMNFTILDQLDFYERPPIGLAIEENFRPDYAEILTRDSIDVCDWVDNEGVDEIWMWSMHTERIEPVESNMSSRKSVPFIDISNSERTDDLPHCARTYVLYNFNFTAGAPNMLHNRGHHIESMLQSNFRDRQVFLFDGFTGEGSQYEELADPLGFYRCGNVHRSINSPAIELPGQPEENNWVDRVVPTDCRSWERTGGAPALINCDTWFEPYWGSPHCFADGGVSWVTWWFQNLPGMGNGMIDDGRQWRNVFDTLGDPDSLLANSTYLFEDEQRRPWLDGGAALEGYTHFVRHEID